MNAPLRDSAGPDRARNIDTVNRFLAGTHGSDIDVVDRTVARDIVTHGFPGGNPSSREEYKEWFRTFRSSFSNMSFEALSTVADETRVAVRWRVGVDHTGPFAGVEPTGRRVVFEGVATYRLENGLIVETWLDMDRLALLAGIGALDPAEAA